MKTWHWIFILTFLGLYGTLSLLLLGSWLYQMARSWISRIHSSLRPGRRPQEAHGGLKERTA